MIDVQSCFATSLVGRYAERYTAREHFQNYPAEPCTGRILVFAC